MNFIGIYSKISETIQFFFTNHFINQKIISLHFIKWDLNQVQLIHHHAIMIIQEVMTQMEMDKAHQKIHMDKTHIIDINHHMHMKMHQDVMHMEMPHMVKSHFLLIIFQ